MLKFIKEIDHISKVPSEIYSVYRGIITKDIVDKFFNKNLNLPRELIIKLIGAIDKLPEKYSILEIGSNIGFVGEEIEKRMQEGFSINGIESSAEMIKLQKQSKRDKVYDKIINLPVENYLIDNNLKNSPDYIINYLNNNIHVKMDKKIEKLVENSYKDFEYVLRETNNIYCLIDVLYEFDS